MFRGRDIYGDTIECLNCGHVRDLDSAGNLAPIPEISDLLMTRRREPAWRQFHDSTGTARCSALKLTDGSRCQSLVIAGGRCRYHRETIHA